MSAEKENQSQPCSKCGLFSQVDELSGICLRDLKTHFISDDCNIEAFVAYKRTEKTP